MVIIIYIKFIIRKNIKLIIRNINDSISDYLYVKLVLMIVIYR